MGTALQTTEEMRGMSSVPSAQELQSLYNYQKYLSNNLKLENNNINFYRSQRLSNYTPDDIRRDEIQEGFGSSKYDYRIPDIAMAYGDLTDFRAAQQGPFLEGLASLGQFATRAIGTIAEGAGLVFGMGYGAGKHAVEALINSQNQSPEDQHNLLYDIIFNPVSNWINETQDNIIDQIPIYKTTEELNNSWWTNVVKHPYTWFLADALPSIGFTAGAMIGGKLNAMKTEAILGKIFKQKEVIDRAAKLGIALEEIPDEKIPSLIEGLKQAGAADKLNIINKYLKNDRIKNSISNWAGILNASATEATVEGYNTRKEYIDEVLPKAYEYMKSDYFRKQLLDNFKRDNEGYDNFEDYRTVKEKQVIKDIVSTADNIGLTTFGANVAFLTAHNKFFWDSFFHPKFALKSSVRDYTKLFDVKTKNGLVEDVTLKKNFWHTHPTAGKIAAIAKNGLGESFEEMEQGRFSESSKALYGSRMNDLFFSEFNALLDPRYSKTDIGLMGAATQGFKDTYLNPERWEEGLIGFLTGIIGLPNIGVHQSGKNKGKKGLTGWNLGGIEEWKAREEKYKQAEEMLSKFRTKEGDNKDSFEAIKQYLVGDLSTSMSKLDITGKSPLDMLRTGIMLNAIRDISNQGDTPTPNNASLNMLYDWKSKVMSGILMGYDTYVQMGISKYFDNWLNFLEGINKQSDEKKEAFINELFNSGIFSKITDNNNKSVIKNYTEKNKQDLLNAVSENARQMKDLLNLYSDIEAKAYDTFYNNFRGEANAYMKIKSLLIGLTKAKAYEQFILDDKNKLPFLNTKADYYNIPGFNKFYDALSKNNAQEKVDALNEVWNSYTKKFPEGTDVSEINKYAYTFMQYAYDIATSDRMQEYIYSITNPEAFNKEAEKASENTEKKVEQKQTADFKEKIRNALTDNSSMQNDSDIINALFEASSPNGKFNPQLINGIPGNWNDIKKYLGLPDKMKADDAKARRFNRLLNEIKSYLNLIGSNIETLSKSQLTDEEKNQLSSIIEALEKGGLFSNVHQKYNDLFNEFFALSMEKKNTNQLDIPKQARYNILASLQLIKDLNDLFDKYLKEPGDAMNVSEGAYQYFTYTKRSKSKTDSTNNTKSSEEGKTNTENEGTVSNFDLRLSLSKKICNILNDRSGNIDNPMGIENLLHCMLDIETDGNKYTIGYETKDPRDDKSDSITISADMSNTCTVKSYITDKEFKVKVGSTNDFDKLTRDNGFSVFSKLTDDTYSVGLALIDFELLSPSNINKLRAVSPEIETKKLPEDIKIRLAQVYNEYKSMSKLSPNNKFVANTPAQPTRTVDTSLYDYEGNVIPNIILSKTAADYVDALNRNDKSTANKLIKKIFADTITASQLLESVLRTENGKYKIILPENPSPTLLRSNIFSFSKGAYIPGVIVDNKTWDIEVSEVDNEGHITNIKEKSLTTPDGTFNLTFNNGVFVSLPVKNDNYKPQNLLKDGEGYQFPITQVDYEIKDSKGNSVVNHINSTKETDNSIKGTPLFKYIRDSILTPSGAYFSMVQQLTDGNFKYNTGDPIYFDFFPDEITDVAVKMELDKFYANYPNLKKGGKLIGIYSSQDESSRELLGVVDPMNTELLRILDENSNTLKDLKYEIKDILTGNSAVMVEPDGKKNKLSDLDPNNECLYIFNNNGVLYSNKSNNKDNTITSEELVTLLGEFDVENMGKDRIYIFSPSRNSNKYPNKRYSAAHTSVELTGITQNRTNTDLQSVPQSIKESLYEFAERWLNTATLSTEEYHNIDDLFYSSINNFHIFEDEDGALKISTSTKEGDSELNQKVVTIDTSNTDSIVNGILQVVFDLDMSLPYKPSELFSNNNQWFNELKPYLITTKAFTGESNVYFKYGPKNINEQDTESVKNNEPYTKPQEETALSGNDTKPVEDISSDDTDKMLMAILSDYLQNPSSDFVNSLKTDITTKWFFSSDNIDRLFNEGVEIVSIKDVENKFKEILPKPNNEALDPCLN